MNFFCLSIIMGFFTVFTGCGQKGNSDTLSTSQPVAKPVENINATPSQRARRQQSEVYCKAHNVPVYANPNSLFVNTDEEVMIRTKDQIVDRALALCFIELRSESADKKMLADFDKRYAIIAKLSPKEKAFILSASPTEQDLVNANWRAEGTHIMLWALGYIDSLSYPDAACTVADDVKRIVAKSEQQFRDNARLRNKKEILDQADLILRLNWACVNARIKGQPAPGKLDSSVVLERHYALNWLVNYLNQNWDDVTTDT